jgi:acyl carrier protein
MAPSPRRKMSLNCFEKLAAYIQREISKDPGRALEADTPLISSGLVDSLSLIAVLAFIEDEFSVVIPDEEATAASMNTIRLMTNLIERYHVPRA